MDNNEHIEIQQKEKDRMAYRITGAANPRWGGSGYESSNGYAIVDGYSEALDELEKRVRHDFNEGAVSKYRDDAPEEYDAALAVIKAARGAANNPELRLSVGSDVHVLRVDGPAPDLVDTEKKSKRGWFW